MIKNTEKSAVLYWLAYPLHVNWAHPQKTLKPKTRQSLELVWSQQTPILWPWTSRISVQQPCMPLLLPWPDHPWRIHEKNLWPCMLASAWAASVLSCCVSLLPTCPGSTCYTCSTNTCLCQIQISLSKHRPKGFHLLCRFHTKTMGCFKITAFTRTDFYLTHPTLIAKELSIDPKVFICCAISWKKLWVVSNQQAFIEDQAVGIYR